MILSKYDNDGNGVVDVDEMKRFVLDRLSDEVDGGLNDEEFDECLREFVNDKDQQD